MAPQIVEKIGGAANVETARHCQTRLRFRLRDDAKADKAALQALDGVLKVIPTGGMHQVVIGTDVADCYEEVLKCLPNLDDSASGTVDEDNTAADTASADEKKNVATAIIDFVSDTFRPVIPALSGAGMLKAIMALLLVLKVIDNTSQTYYIINFFADAVFYFLPILLAFSEAQKLKCNPVLAAAIAGIMMHPNWSALVTAGETVHFFEIILFRLVSYSGTVIPIIVAVFVQSYVEKLLNRIVPKAVNLVFVPMLTFLVMGTLALAVLGPIGNVIGCYLAVFFTYLADNVSWPPAVLIGAFLPPMVMFGLHNGVAALVVAFGTKNSKTRQQASFSGVTALMGITEPVLYGVNLPKKYLLISAMIGGGCGGLYASLTHTHRFAIGSSGLPAVLLYIGDNTMQYLVNIIIAFQLSRWLYPSVSMIAIGLLYDMTGNYSAVLVLFAAFCVVALLLWNLIPATAARYKPMESGEENSAVSSDQGHRNNI